MAMVKVACAVVMCVAVVAVAVGPMAAEAVISCGQVQSSLGPCINYLRNGGAVPAPCCNGVRAVANAAQTPTDRRAACECMKTAASRITDIKLPNAASLPGKCGVSIPYKISPDTNCATVN